MHHRLNNMLSVFKKIFAFMLPILVFACAYVAWAQVSGASITTGSASERTATSAKLNGAYEVTAGQFTDYVMYFKYGIDPNLPDQAETTIETTGQIAGGMNGPVFNIVSGLTPETTYYFSACITSIGQGTRSCAATASFKTDIAQGGFDTGNENGGFDTGSENGGFDTGGENGGLDTGTNTGSSNTNTSGSNSSTSTGGNLSSDKLQNPLGGVNTIPELIAKILDIILKVAVPVIVIFIIYAGFQYVIARGDTKKIEAAHQTLLYTVLGAAIILAAWTIAQALAGTISKLK